ncbi:Hypothetical predicted protein [Lecanosticta acicola]|uniref:Uncharacterized protein n=1 Tax=Lecanosticta acicola TaxID=111012 RepID=A0AAI8Z8H3_9PEZI|nr:Hypothetical predicted protein [Lecanosticta acicola]
MASNSQPGTAPAEASPEENFQDTKSGSAGAQAASEENIGDNVGGEKYHDRDTVAQVADPNYYWEHYSLAQADLHRSVANLHPLSADSLPDSAFPAPTTKRIAPPPPTKEV